ncbi:MAG TPA: citryl-CoA lyase [Thermoleophilaceae bacterium]|jgi:citrate synthase|nr:citryl-CoA lyase [Thermoleophilaceae bacterium]
MSFETSVGTSDADSITVMGRDVASELMGGTTLTELAFLLVQRREPTPEETRLLDTVLVSLADHGLTPTVLAARLTYTGAPESLQGAVAAGLLGAGSVFLGVVEDTVRFLDEIGDDVKGGVRRELEAGRRIPGLGHPIHKTEDPRTPRIYAIAEETGLLGPYLTRLRELAAAHRDETGKELPINGAGVAGAALADLGFPGPLLRGFALLARTAGLLGHLAEELQSPIGMRLYREVDERAKYVPPTGK